MADFSLSRAPAQELAFRDQVRRLDRFRTGRIALQISLSRLSTSFRRIEYIRIATETFKSNTKSFDGQLYVLRNCDIIFIAKDLPRETFEGVASHIRALFKNDPLVQYGNEEKGTGLCNWFDVETRYNDLLDLTEDYIKLAEQCRLNPELATFVSDESFLAPVHPDLLAKLEQSLNQTDVTNIVRHQTICTLFDEREPQALFDEFFVSIDDLQNITTPGSDLRSNKWLFQHLTQSLDRRMLLKILRDGMRYERPFSLNLNLTTVLSPEFLKFEESIPPQFKGRLVVELNKVDVFADMTTFFFVRDFLHDHGFRICLDGLTHHTLGYYDRSRLGFDLIKIYWTPDSIDIMPEDMVPTIRNQVMEAGQARTILCRCDDAHAVEIGQQLGIVMFEGRYVEKILNAKRDNLTAQLVSALN